MNPVPIPDQIAAKAPELYIVAVILAFVVLQGGAFLGVMMRHSRKRDEAWMKHYEQIAASSNAMAKECHTYQARATKVIEDVGRELGANREAIRTNTAALERVHGVLDKLNGNSPRGG